MMKYDLIAEISISCISFLTRKPYYFAPGMSNGNNKYKVFILAVMISIVDEF